MATTNFENGFQVFGNNEAPIGRKVKAKIGNGPTLQRAALGDVRNKQAVLKDRNAIVKKAIKVEDKTIIKAKNNETSVLSGKENVTKIKAPKVVKKSVEKEKDESMEVDENADLGVEELSVAFSSQCLDVEDIDAEDKDNPQLVSDYVKDIYKYMWELESENKVECNYLDGQKITYRMRSILIDWLVQVHSKFSLLQETLYLTVAIIDRYLMTNRTTVKEHLQLVGVTAMLIASKYEEMYIPEIGDFVYITDKTFTKSDIRKMEVKILKTLGYYISYPLPLHFLRRNSKAGMVDAAHHTLAKYLMELTLPEYTFCHIKPSTLAAAALYLSMNLINDGSKWSDTLTYYSKYSEKEIAPVVRKLASLVIKSNSSKLHAVRDKYASNKFMKISDLHELKSDSRLLRKIAS